MEEDKDIKHCNDCNSEFHGDADIIREHCPFCGDNETVSFEAE